MMVYNKVQRAGSSYERYVSGIRLDMDIPWDNAIAYNDAYDAALQHLAQQPKWSAEQAGMFRPSMNKDERYMPKAVKQEGK